MLANRRVMGVASLLETVWVKSSKNIPASHRLRPDSGCSTFLSPPLLELRADCKRREKGMG